MAKLTGGTTEQDDYKRQGARTFTKASSTISSSYNCNRFYALKMSLFNAQTFPFYNACSFLAFDDRPWLVVLAVTGGYAS